MGNEEDREILRAEALDAVRSAHSVALWVVTTDGEVKRYLVNGTSALLLTVAQDVLDRDSD